MAHEKVQPELSERARGWLKYLYRKAMVDDDWSKTADHPKCGTIKACPPWETFIASTP